MPMEPVARHLIFHASLVLLFGLLCGIPYAKAINRSAPEPIQRAWRVAHLALPLGATLMLAIAAILGPLAVSATIKWLLACSFIVAGYGFCFALTLAPLVGHRGLTTGGPWQARLVYIGNSAGAWSSLAGSLLLVYAAWVSL
jgi:hypothetical protein